jgi:hypothetical protein
MAGRMSCQHASSACFRMQQHCEWVWVWVPLEAAAAGCWLNRRGVRVLQLPRGHLLL